MENVAANRQETSFHRAAEGALTPRPADWFASPRLAIEALFPGIPQHLPQVQVERTGNSQESIQRRHPHPAFHEGHGLLGQAGASGHLIHGQAEVFPPFSDKAAGFFADFDSRLIVQETTTVAK